jgi:hypothetical protein
MNNNPIIDNATYVLEKIRNESLQTNIIAILPEVLVIVKEIIYKISLCQTIQDTSCYFDLLDKIQFVMARLVFRDDVPVTQELRKFIRDCDRLDDPWLRDYLFKKIKSGEYNLASDDFL